MKLKYYIIVSTILICNLSIPKNTKAQTTINWDASGATWVYKMIAMTTNHYQILRMEGDTTIASQIAKKIRITEFFIESYGGDSYRTPETYVRTEYMYESSDSIFIYQNENFDLLYDFSASVDDSWQIRPDSSYLCTDGSTPISFSDEILVYQKSVEPHFGVDLETLHISDNGLWTLGYQIIPGIGSLTTPFPQITSMACTNYVIDGGIGYYQSLQCYYNDETGYFGAECELLTSSSQPNIPINIGHSFPNPTMGIVYFKDLPVQKEMNFYVYDVTGKLCFEDKGMKDNINIEHLEKGVYFISVVRKNGTLSQVFKTIKM